MVRQGGEQRQRFDEPVYASENSEAPCRQAEHVGWRHCNTDSRDPYQIEIGRERATKTSHRMVCHRDSQSVRGRNPSPTPRGFAELAAHRKPKRFPEAEASHNAKREMRAGQKPGREIRPQAFRRSDAIED